MANTLEGHNLGDMAHFQSTTSDVVIIGGMEGTGMVEVSSSNYFKLFNRTDSYSMRKLKVGQNCHHIMS